MSEAGMGGDGYRDLIKEVFIDPIRSVVVVDDEFPTLDALLDNDNVENKLRKWDKKNVSRVRDIIKICREARHRWIVDVHDGSTSISLDEEREAASHLHQSDLLILDFHLNKQSPEDGTDAIKILRELASNDHFNLVIVYTGGYREIGGDIDRVVNEIAVGLSCADDRIIFKGPGYDQILEIFRDWEDLEPQIFEKIRESVDDGVYVKVIGEESLDLGRIWQWQGLAAFRALIESAPSDLKKKINIKSALKWVLQDRQEKLCAKLASKNLGKIKFGHEQGQVNWIRADRVFVTVVGKSNEPSVLPIKLMDALRFWNPEPHRLLLSKMRAELDERGVVAENQVLGNRHLQAGWMEEYLTDDKEFREWRIKGTVGRHWDGLGWAIKTKVTSFAVKLADHLQSNGGDRIVEEWFPNRSSHEIAIHHNRYVNCKVAVEGVHLNTGHIMAVGGVSGETEYWVCLSPACDLVPGQKTTGWIGRLGGYLPFLAVELHEVKAKLALPGATAGNHLFLEIDSAMKCFCFTPVVSASSTAGAAVVTNPRWEQMFAASSGKFSENKIRIARANGQKGELGFHESDACIIAELRYEYALNLLQKLGGNLSRIGLDFISFSEGL